MKYLFIFFAFVILQLVVKSQSKCIISGTVITENDYNFNIYEPINSYYNIVSLDTQKIHNIKISKAEKNFKREINIEQPTVISIVFMNADRTQHINKCDLLLIPGDSFSIEFNLEKDNPEWTKFKGSNAAGHNLFNLINYQPIEKFAGIFSISDNFIFHNNELKYLSDIDSCLNFYAKQFSELYNHKNISETYRSYINLNFKLLFYVDVCNKMIKYRKTIATIPLLKRRMVVEKLFEKLPSLNNNLKGLYLSELYTGIYYEYEACKKENLEYSDQLISDDKNIFINDFNLTINKYLIPFTYIQNNVVQSDIWALNLMMIFSTYRDLLDEKSIEQYIKIFPNNRWENYIKIQFEKFKKIQKIDYYLQSPIIYIDSLLKYSYLSDLLKQLPNNKPIFIDLWATWCSPCIEAFDYNKQLDSLLIVSKIEKLYISIDDITNTIKWKQAILKYKLGGYHIIGNKNLISDIKKITGTEKNYGMRIPRYIIIDKDKKIINIDASSPSDFEILKSELNKIIIK